MFYKMHLIDVFIWSSWYFWYSTFLIRASFVEVRQAISSMPMLCSSLTAKLLNSTSILFFLLHGCTKKIVSGRFFQAEICGSFSFFQGKQKAVGFFPPGAGIILPRNINTPHINNQPCRAAAFKEKNQRSLLTKPSSARNDLRGRRNGPELQQQPPQRPARQPLTQQPPC